MKVAIMGSVRVPLTPSRDETFWTGWLSTQVTAQVVAQGCGLPSSPPRRPVQRHSHVQHAMGSRDPAGRLAPDLGTLARRVQVSETDILRSQPT